MSVSERVATTIATMTDDELRAQYEARKTGQWPDKAIGYEKTTALYESDGLLLLTVYYEFLDQAEQRLQEIQIP